MSHIKSSMASAPYWNQTVDICKARMTQSTIWKTFLWIFKPTQPSVDLL